MGKVTTHRVTLPRGRFARALSDIERRVRAIPLDGAAPDLAADAFRDTFAASVWTAHRLERDPCGPGLVPTFLVQDGWTDDGVKRHRDVLARPAANGALRYDPDRAPEGQRDRAVVLRDLLAASAPAVVDQTRAFLRDLDLETSDQLRVLVCDGPFLLGWVGGLREEPFTVREQRGLSRLVPALRAALLWRLRLAEAGLARAGMVASMEAVGCPAFLLSGAGAIAHANTLGRELAAERAASLRADLRDALASGRADAIAVRAAGVPDHELVLVRAREQGTPLAWALARAEHAWSLSRRQREVLEHLATGDTNKGIAAKLGCAEVTIELHVTALLRKSGASTRSELTARFWSTAPKGRT